MPRHTTQQWKSKQIVWYQLVHLFFWQEKKWNQIHWLIISSHYHEIMIFHQFTGTSHHMNRNKLMMYNHLIQSEGLHVDNTQTFNHKTPMIYSSSHSWQLAKINNCYKTWRTEHWRTSHKTSMFICRLPSNQGCMALTLLPGETPTF